MTKMASIRLIPVRPPGRFRRFILASRRRSYAGIVPRRAGQFPLESGPFSAGRDNRRRLRVQIESQFRDGLPYPRGPGSQFDAAPTDQRSADKGEQAYSLEKTVEFGTMPLRARGPRKQESCAVLAGRFREPGKRLRKDFFDSSIKALKESRYGRKNI